MNKPRYHYSPTKDNSLVLLDIFRCELFALFKVDEIESFDYTLP